MKTITSACALLFLLSPPAWAVLGQRVYSVPSVQQLLKGELRSLDREGYSALEVSAPDGTVVTEYVGADGIVFGLSWRGPTVPNLETLLGDYFARFHESARSASRRRGFAGIHTDALVVESSGHPRAFRGRAYVPALVPAKLSPAVVE